MLRSSNPVIWNQVKVTDGFWKKRLTLNETVTLPAEYNQCKETGRIDSVKCIYDKTKEHDAKYIETIDGKIELTDGESAGVPRPHHYWDSDVAKWIEAAAYSLLYKPDADLEKCIDGIVEDFAAAQYPDGYINTYFTVVEPGKRWTNVYQMHELYCAGHLLEAAIAYYQATGKSRFLDIIRKYVDYIDQTFGPDEGKIHGYPGHQEIELALVKLYQLTGVERYLNLAKYFIDARGTKPLFFEQEALKQGRDLNYGGPKGILGKDFLAPGPYALFQSHLPVREQKSAEGHAVRVVYMGTAMVDVAMESGDESLLNAAETLWDNITERRMAITGGVGAKDQSERFAYDYYLPNEICYNETCASIGLAMWAYRFLQYSADTKYADILEKALYNGIISGVSLSGDRFFYANHLASDPDMFKDRIITNPRMLPERQSWFAVSCCPMNLARITESIGGYMYTASDDTIFCHIYASGIARINGHVIEQKTEYPWNGNIVIEPDSGNYTIALRIPGWCDSFSIKVNGNDADYSMKKGYAYIRNNWTGSDSITLNLCMRPFLVEANPLVRMDAGKVAIQYGPLIYCIEEADNGSQVFDLFLSRECSLTTHFEEDLLGGVVVVEGEGYVHDLTKWQHRLYSKVSSNASFERKKFRAIPYYAWANRGNGKMTVWLNSLQTERK